MRMHLVTAAAVVVVLVSAGVAAAQAPASPQTFPLTDAAGLVARAVTIDTTRVFGRTAVRLVKTPGEGVDGFVPLPAVDFQDGTIEADLAVKVTRSPGPGSPGFIGIAFRATADASRYDMFYIRPGIAGSDDQAARNHAAQYCAAPGFSWYPLRRDWPWVYEGHADLRLDGWTHVKIDVAGRIARLYLNHNPEPTLVVDGMKGLDLRGGVSLFTFVGQEAYFSNVRITHAVPLPVQNGSDAAGRWDVTLATDAGSFAGTLRLQRDGARLTGTWSGALGTDRAVSGTWRDGYVELTFPGDWPTGTFDGAPGPVTVTLAGWIDGPSAKGRSRVASRADGVWTATRGS